MHFHPNYNYRRSKIASALCLAAVLSASFQSAHAEEYLLEKAEKYRLSGQYRLAVDEAEKLLAGPGRDNGDVHYFYAFGLNRLKGDRAKVKHHLEEGLRIAPYSWYSDDGKRLLVQLEKEDKERLEIASLPGAKVGLTLVDGAVVEAVEANSSAAKAGILAGDKIAFVDNVSTSFMSTKSVAARLAGPAGSRVAVAVSRNGNKFNCFLYRSKTNSLAAASTVANARTQTAPTTSSGKATAPARVTEQSRIQIEVFRRTKATEDCEEKVKLALVYIPISVAEELKRKGVTVQIVPDIIMAEPHLAGQKPGAHNFGYDNCCGLYRPRDKKIVIPERFSFGNAPLQVNPYVLWTTLHEVGHAFDYAARYSESDLFTKAYEDDAKYINNEIRVKYRYFLDRNVSGLDELFAEIFSAVVAPNEDLRAVALSKSFPRCTKVIEELAGMK